MDKKIVVAQIMGKWLGGGVESVVMNYYRNIDREKVQFDFICDEDSTDIPYDEIKSLGGRVILSPPYQKVFKYQKELYKILKRGNYKVVHSHLNTLSVFPLFAAKRAKIPVRIAHSHSTTNKKEIKNIMKQILRPFAKKYATHYFCCSELAGRWLFKNKAYDEGKVVLLNNAIELEKFKYDIDIRNKVRKESGIADNTIIIGHLGRFVKTKNHEFLIDIFKYLHKTNINTKLLLVGQGPLEEDIKSKIKEMNLTDSVIFLGQRKDVNELYQAMDLVLFPSLYEGLGIVLIEAQVSGIPCIASTNVSLEAKVTENLDFISLKSSPVYWATKSLSVFKNNIRKSHINDIRRKGYDIKKEAQKLENMYLNM